MNLRNIMEYHLKNIDLRLYEDETVFYFYSMLFLHSTGQCLLDKDIGYHVGRLLESFGSHRNESFARTTDILKQYVPPTAPSEIQKSIWKTLYYLYMDLRIEENADKTVLSQIAVDFLYTVASTSKRISEYTTPRELIEIISQMSEPFAGKSVYNPFCGCGGFLSSLFLNKNDNPACFLGTEPNHKIADISKLLSYFCTGTPENIKTADALLQSTHNQGEKQTYDIILSQIPFGVYSEDYRRFKPPNPDMIYDSRIDCHLLNHMLNSAGDNAVIAAVIPNGFLFREGNDEILRKHIIKENYLDTIVSLPANLLYNTRVPASVIVLKKNRPLLPILFIDAAKDPQIVNVNRKQSVITPFGIDKITSVYKNRIVSSGFSKLVNTDEISNNLYKLNIDRYIYGVVGFIENKPDLLSLERDIMALQSEISTIENELKYCYTSFFNEHDSTITIPDPSCTIILY